MIQNKEKVKKKPLNMVFTILGGLFVIGIISEALTSTEVDTLCSTNGKFLYRDNGNWTCGIATMENITINNTIINNNYNQVLNTTSDVTFNKITANNITISNLTCYNNGSHMIFEV